MSITRCEQDVDSAVGTGANDYEVGYAYAKVASTGRNTIRRTGLTQRYASTDKLSLTYEYLSTGNSLDDAASRLSRVKVSTTVVALYKYMGDGTVVNTAYPDIDVFKPVNTSITGVYRMDNFNRITDDRWVKDLDTDQQFVELDIAYDRNSNIVGVEDQILGGGTGFDVHYDIDDLDRLTFADEGNLSAGAIAGGTRTRKGNWTLSQTGNWHGNLRDLDGDGAYDDVGDEDLTAFTYNVANEWTARTITIGTGGGTSTTAYTRTHDAVGNLIDDGEDYEYVYDPFGRLKEVRKTSNQSLVAEYRYNGLGFRVGWHYDVDADGTVESTSDDPWFFFAYDEGWRVVATYRSTDSSPKEQFVHHMAGLGGYGGSSYIDAVILRERDANSAWASAADGTLEERLYYAQNWRADVVAIVSAAGKLVERVRYSAYGIPTAFPAGDTDSDGDWDATDSAAIGGSYALLEDADLDGDVDAADITHANSITGGYQTLGRDTLSSPAVNSRRGYAGYEYSPEFAGDARHLFHVRHRVYDAEAGRWTRRDPLAYVDGASMYEYVRGQLIARSDPMGQASTPCGTSDSGCGGLGGPLDPAPPHNPIPRPPPTGITVNACTQCALKAMQEPGNMALIAEMTSRGCPFGFSGCEICGAGPPPPPAKGWWDGTAIHLCADRMPNCEYAKVLFSHELWHAYDRCQGHGGDTCCDCVCRELRAYRWDRGCADGGIRRGVPGPNGKVPASEKDCLRMYVGNSCNTEGYPCFGQPGMFDACFNSLYDDSECYPISVGPPPIRVVMKYQ